MSVVGCCPVGCAYVVVVELCWDLVAVMMCGIVTQMARRVVCLMRTVVVSSVLGVRCVVVVEIDVRSAVP